MSKRIAFALVASSLIAFVILGPNVTLAQGLPDCCDTVSPCAGDVNNDGLVDPLDSGFILARLGDDVTASNNCIADVNCDGLIDPLDVGFALERFNSCDAVIACAPGGGACDSLPPDECCPTDDTPGCDDPVIKACVCAFDPFCCLTWDEACSLEVEIFDCADCSGDPCADGIPINDDCECVTPMLIENNQIVEFHGDATGATQDCVELGGGLSEVWHAWTQNESDSVTIDYCGTIEPPDYFFIVIDDNCPCDGDFIFNSQPVTTVDCGDGTTSLGIRFWNLAAGTYYCPILAGTLGIDGPYAIRIRRN